MATVIPYNRELEFEYGASQRLSPLVRRVIAPNPSAFTFHGTGTYIIGKGSGSGSVAIVDPGPDLPEHVDAVLAAVSGETVSHILVTHTHLDHSPATVAVKAATGAPSYAFGPHGRGGDGEQAEEGADFDFMPDHRVADGETVAGDGWSVEGVHTPGHTSNHMCFALKEENALFPGDHVMG
ncbi:MAG: MBL fold metallo-hydrolase, partial [Alphaproteobacteria bacterium]|nr:MBL fold metallo-hydrolase [Alphaproteobacteria bacterium]